MIKQDQVNLLVKLAGSHITQHTNGAHKSEWEVFTNDDEEMIMKFPNNYSESDIFRIMDFAKKYELEALNAGIKFQKNRQNEVLKGIIDDQKTSLNFLKEENEKLAGALDKATKKFKEV